MKRIKRFILLTFCISLSCLFTSCNTSGIQSTSEDKNVSGNDSSSSSESDKVSITISWWGGETRHEATQKAIKAFEEKNPGINVNVRFGAWYGWEYTMSTAFYAGTEPDINQINWNWISDYSSDGSMFLDLNTLSDYFDFSNYEQSILKECTVAGELQAIPVSMTGRIFYWNKTTFDKAGIDIPSSLEQLYDSAEKFSEKLGDDYYPLVLCEYDRMILMVYYLESVYGKAWVTDGKLNYSKKEIAEGLEFIQSLEDKHVTPTIPEILGDGAVSPDKDPEWIKGKYAGIFEWDSAALKFSDSLDKGQKLVVGDYFSDMGKYHGGFAKISLAFAVSENTKYPKECAMLLDFLLNDPEGAAMMAGERGIPLSKSAFKACTQKGNFNDIVSQANKKVLDWVRYPLDSKFENTKLKGNPDGVYYDVFSGLSYGDYDIDEAASVLYSGITDVMGDL